MADNPLGVNIGENSIRVADATLTNNQIVLNSLGSAHDTPLFFEIDTEKTVTDEVALLEKLVNVTKLKKKSANIVIPDSSSYSQILTMPVLKEKELLSAIKYQADQFIPMPLDQAALDVEVLFEDQKNKKLIVLIVASATSLIAKIEKLAELSGLVPESIENELSATARLLSMVYKPKAPPTSATLFVNFGFSSTSFYLFHNGLNLVLDNHTFKIGLNLFSREIEVNTKLDTAKSREALKTIGLGRDGSVNFEDILKPATVELAAEAEKYIIAAKEKFSLSGISQIYLLNLSSSLRHLDQKLSQYLTLPVTIMDLSQYFLKNPTYSANAPEMLSYVSAISACLR